MSHYVVFTGGGTGGHVYPALAVWEHLSDPLRRHVIWIGSATGIEKRLVRKRGIHYIAIPTGKLRRYFSVQNVIDLCNVVLGVIVARRHLRRLRPSIVFSKGGFVAVPVVWAAASLGVPVLIHESDSSPGLATRLSLPFARTVFVSYGETMSFLRPKYRKRVSVVGNPIRKAIVRPDNEIAPSWLRSIPNSEPVCVFFGGSLGAHQLNHLLAEIIEWLTARITVIHQTGAEDADMISSLHAKAVTGRYYGQPYFEEEFGLVLGRADFAVTRAGAGTIWELAATSTPAILIPLGTHASRGDQIQNAERYLRVGAAEVIPSEVVSDHRLKETIAGFLNHPDRLRNMTDAAKRFGSIDGANRIAERIHSFFEGEKETWN